MVTPELKLTKKVTADKEGARPSLPRMPVERASDGLKILRFVCGH